MLARLRSHSAEPVRRSAEGFKVPGKDSRRAGRLAARKFAALREPPAGELFSPVRPLRLCAEQAANPNYQRLYGTVHRSRLLPSGPREVVVEIEFFGNSLLGGGIDHSFLRDFRSAPADRLLTER